MIFPMCYTMKAKSTKVCHVISHLSLNTAIHCIQPSTSHRGLETLSLKPCTPTWTLDETYRTSQLPSSRCKVGVCPRQGILSGKRAEKRGVPKDPLSTGLRCWVCWLWRVMLPVVLSGRRKEKKSLKVKRKQTKQKERKDGLA